MKEDLLSLIKTKEEANKLFGFIDLVKEKSYGTEKFDKSTIESCQKEIFSKEKGFVKPIWFEKVCKFITKNVSPESVRDLADEIEKIVSKAELVKVETSFEPTASFVEDVFKEIKESGIKDFILDIEYNPKLKGGAKFFINGKYVDLTLNSVIKNYLRTKDVINRYL